MSQQTTIRKLAELVNTPVEKLLEQLAEAGMSFSGPDQVVTSMEKVKLLGFLKRSHGKSDAAVDEAAPKKITLNRRKQQEVTVNAGRSKTTVNVEVRQKRTYVKPTDAESVATNWQSEADPERAEILRKLEESRQRNLDEQRRLAQEDAKRAEELERRRQEEAEARAAAEAARAQAEIAVQPLWWLAGLPSRAGTALRVGYSKHVGHWRGQVDELRFYTTRTLSSDEARWLAVPETPEAIARVDSILGLPTTTR